MTHSSFQSGIEQLRESMVQEIMANLWSYVFYRETKEQSRRSPVSLQMLSVHITASNTNDNGNNNIHSTQSSPTRRNSGQTPIPNAPTHGHKKSKHEGDTVNKTEVKPDVKKERNEETPLLKICQTPLLKFGQTPIPNAPKMKTSTCGQKNSEKREVRPKVKKGHDEETPLLKIGQTPIPNAPNMKTSTCGQKNSKHERETANKTEVRPNVKKEQDKENPLLKIGHRFYSIEEVERAKELYEQKHFCELWKRDSRTLESAKKRVPKRVKHAEISLQYYSLKLSCKFGGKGID